MERTRYFSKCGRHPRVPPSRCRELLSTYPRQVFNRGGAGWGVASYMASKVFAYNLSIAWTHFKRLAGQWKENRAKEFLHFLPFYDLFSGLNTEEVSGNWWFQNFAPLGAVHGSCSSLCLLDDFHQVQPEKKSWHYMIKAMTGSNVFIDVFWSIWLV